jgi:glutamate decarboxylase
LSYVGVGWIIWRDKAHLPEDLIFELHYLGSIEFTFSLTFSRGAAPIVAQYFNLLHLGFQGYRKVALDDLKNARSLSRALEKSGYFVVLSDIHRARGSRSCHGIDSPNFEVCHKQCGRIVLNSLQDYEPGLPVVAFKFSEEFKKSFPHLQQKWIQTLLRTRGW